MGTQHCLIILLGSPTSFTTSLLSSNLQRILPLLILSLPHISLRTKKPPEGNAISFPPNLTATCIATYTAFSCYSEQALPASTKASSSEFHSCLPLKDPVPATTTSSCWIILRYALLVPSFKRNAHTHTHACKRNPHLINVPFTANSS